MEHQTLTLIRDVETRSGWSAEPLIAHELAHQWWGDSVTLKDWRHIWLNEGFASYGDALWREHVMGPDSLRTRMELFGRLFRFVYITRNIADPVVNPPASSFSAPRSTTRAPGCFTCSATSW